MAIDLAFEPVRGQGAIYAYTIMYHAGDKRFASAIPYASIIVELDDAPGALMAGNLLGAPYTEAKVGRRVEVIFEPLNDDAFFAQVRVNPETGTIEWPNGADLDPDVLYSKISGEPLPDFAKEPDRKTA